MEAIGRTTIDIKRSEKKFDSNFGCLIGDIVVQQKEDDPSKRICAFAWFSPFGSFGTMGNRTAANLIQIVRTYPNTKGYGTVLNNRVYPIVFRYEDTLIPDPLNGVDYYKVLDDQNVRYAEISTRIAVFDEELSKLEKEKANLLSDPQRAEIDAVKKSIGFIYHTYKKDGMADDPYDQLRELENFDVSNGHPILDYLNRYANAKETTLDGAYDKLVERFNNLKRKPIDLEPQLESLQRRWDELKKENFPSAVSTNLISKQVVNVIRTDLLNLGYEVPDFTSELQVLNHLNGLAESVDVQSQSIVGRLKAEISNFQCDTAALQAELDSLVRARLLRTIAKYNGGRRSIVSHVVCTPQK